MIKVEFEKLYIFDSSVKKAYVIQFKSGLNIITSSLDDGNDKGKSMIMKSLYYAMGADITFPTSWKINSKEYILNFKIDDIKYTIYRHNKMFKLFDFNDELLLRTTHRSELSKKLNGLWGFSVYAMNNNKELEEANVVLNYLLNYIDQDCQKGSHANSFKNLQQYKQYQKYSIYSHFGVYNKDYFNLNQEKQKLQKEIDGYQKDIELFERIISDVADDLKSYNSDYDKDSLVDEIEYCFEDLMNITKEINKIKVEILTCRDQDYALNDIKEKLKKNQKIDNDIAEHVIKNFTCPECHSHLQKPIVLISKKFNQIEDKELLIRTLEEEIEKINNKISNQYKILDKKLEDYRGCKSNLNIDDDKENYFEFLGLTSIKRKKIGQVNKIENLKISLNSKLKEYQNKITAIEKSIQNFNDIYCEKMLNFKNKLNLEDITQDDLTNLIKKIEGGGSNRPVITLAYYLIFNEIKKEHNKDTTFYPMVVDSPLNAEIDDNKKDTIIKYLFDFSQNYHQTIISMIGYDDYCKDISSKLNVVELTNEKNQLLNNDMYIENKNILDKYL